MKKSCKILLLSGCAVGFICVVGLFIFLKTAKPKSESVPESYPYTEVQMQSQPQRDSLRDLYNRKAPVALSASEFEEQSTFWSCAAQKEVFSQGLSSTISVTQTLYLWQLGDFYAIYDADEPSFVSADTKFRGESPSTWEDFENIIFGDAKTPIEITCGASFVSEKQNSKAVLVTCTFYPKWPLPDARKNA